MEYTNELGRSLVMERTLRTLVEEKKVFGLSVVRAPRTKTAPEPRADEDMIFVALFEMDLRILSIELVVGALHLYGVELAQLTPKSIVQLGIFEWMMQARGAEGSASLITYLHNARCQPKQKKGTNAMVSFGSANFQPKASKLLYMLAPAS